AKKYPKTARPHPIHTAGFEILLTIIESRVYLASTPSAAASIKKIHQKINNKQNQDKNLFYYAIKKIINKQHKPNQVDHHHNLSTDL
ncbi:hypothetical protein, partial [Erwinia amylovora]|uniref:hypothetical protein n=1 Tax=Erwinia amylovora TaxID=552 RepID=UPI0020BE9BBB